MAPTTAPVMLVEDQEADALIFRYAVEQARWRNPIVHCRDGDEALERLLDTSQPLPAFVILDLHLPGRDGFDVLSVARAEPHTRRLPILVLTTSEESRDVRRAYELGANTYLLKPVTVEGLIDAMTRLGSFWLDLVVLPDS